MALVIGMRTVGVTAVGTTSPATKGQNLKSPPHRWILRIRAPLGICAPLEICGPLGSAAPWDLGSLWDLLPLRGRRQSAPNTIDFNSLAENTQAKFACYLRGNCDSLHRNISRSGAYAIRRKVVQIWS